MGDFKRTWTNEEIDFLKINHKSMTYIEIANHIGKSKDSVRGKAERLKLRKIHEYPSVGQKFGYLTVIEELGVDNFNYLTYLCQCDCGKKVKVKGVRLTAKFRPRMSCGCRANRHRFSISNNPAGVSAKKYWYKTYCRGATSRNLSFDLSMEEFFLLIFQNCYYCNSEPKPKNHLINKDGTIRQAASRSSPEYLEKNWLSVNGIDRKDNNIGYNLDNCVPCCTRCNIAKMDYDSEDFIYHAILIAEFQKGKK